MTIMNIKIQVPIGIQSNNKPLTEMHFGCRLICGSDNSVTKQ